MVSPVAGLPKSGILSGKADISALMSSGHWGSLPGLKYCWLEHGENGPEGSRLMVSVPKKFFKRAVRRNLLKRRLREAYRLQKGLLCVEKGVDLMLLYNTAEVLDFVAIKGLVAEVLTKISER